jgi:hypothetical protein
LLLHRMYASLPMLMYNPAPSGYVSDVDTPMGVLGQSYVATPVAFVVHYLQYPG